VTVTVVSCVMAKAENLNLGKKSISMQFQFESKKLQT
jgi:hypothetical protein